MSETPPAERPASGEPAAGDGVTVTVNEARGGMRTGRVIWILVISIVAATVVLLGYWGLHAGHMQRISSGGSSGGHDVNTQDVGSYAAPEPAPRQRTPEMATTNNTAS